MSAHHFQSDFLESGFGVAHGGGRVAVYGAEVSVAVYQGIANVKILGQTHQGVVNGAVAMGMIFPHSIPNDTSAFFMRFFMSDAIFVHGVQNAAVNRLQTVSDIGQGPAYDDASWNIQYRIVSSPPRYQQERRFY